MLTVVIQEVFQKWAEGQITSEMVVKWLEYITIPDLLQFELIHESTQQVLDMTYLCKDGPSHIVGLECCLQ